MKKYISYLLVLVILVMFAEDATAQRKKRRKSREKEEAREEFSKPWKDNMIYEIGFGNPSFIGGSGSSQFNIALKPGVGYKFHDRIAAGAFGKWDYLFVNQFGQEFSLHDYGVGLFTKFKIVEAFYLRGEYALQSYSYDRRTGFENRENFLEPLIGAGYRSGVGKWVFGGEVLFHLSRDVRNYAGQVIEFWIKIDYNF